MISKGGELIMGMFQNWIKSASMENMSKTELIDTYNALYEVLHDSMTNEYQAVRIEDQLDAIAEILDDKFDYQV